MMDLFERYLIPSVILLGYNFSHCHMVLKTISQHMLHCYEFICSCRPQTCVLELEVDPELETAFCWRRDRLKRQRHHVWTE